MKQILLVTDGCSNVGVSPVIAAAEAHASGITVNVVGIVDQGDLVEFGTNEIEEIAKAGGGLSRLSHTRQLSQTVQMLTRKTVVQTIQHAVHHELKQVLGASSIEELPPDKRGEVVRVIDDLSETSSLSVALLIDASASMKPKLHAVEEAIRDLAISLKSRQGSSELAVFHFPGSAYGEDCKLDLDWTRDISGVNAIFPRLQMRGTTPTGPAILHVIDFYQKADYGNRKNDETDGMMSDYVV
ncbi:vWA domain-containing protein [Paenibacillus sacheonensis]|uniref:VWA domain-containing protein n=1 Tax=Paenibacillus sacheonensis TaxID=742054 RepID=A0A7X4YY11_9BACL|nr:vWA domain-containing protein [Paenibacillus sacheonensis]MBM7569302.1 Ca-activated chloride channel family protein [Paenibacillus sacheonensis]NBC73514.1 VWA domain-containing protein [Paenibacillus sacheonensis]